MLNSTIPFRIGTDIVDILRFKTKPLKNNQNFYHECSLQSRENYQKYFSEEVFLKHMTEVFS